MLLTRLSRCGVAQSTALISTRLSGSLSESSDRFFLKQTKLGRPLSPHLTIYKPQLTSLMSITHRVTGVICAVTLYGGAILTVCPGGFTSYVHLAETIAPGAGIIIALKAIVLFPLVYHTFNGFRHLLWDSGRGFKIEELYRSGYIVLGLSFVTCVAIAASL